MTAEQGRPSFRRRRQCVALFASVLMTLGSTWKYYGTTRSMLALKQLSLRTEYHDSNITTIPEPFAPSTVKTFRDAMQQIDWQDFNRAAEDSGTDEAKWIELSIWKQVFYAAFDFAIREPLTAINTTCVAPTLKPPTQQECDSFPSAFSGPVRTVPLKIAHAVQLGFDADTLEVHLNELHGVVDKFFIIEWTQTHNRHICPKPLTWEAVKLQDRFSKFHSKVVHLLMDDVDSASVGKGMWDAEDLQEIRRWQKIREWNERTGFFSQKDIIGFGDTDEIASRYNVHLLKYCRVKSDSPVDIGIWFPFGRIHQAYRTDFPVRGHPYTLGDPTFFTFAQAQKGLAGANAETKTLKYPTRSRGKSPNYLLGGMHMTHYGYLSYMLLKKLSCSECELSGNSKLRKQLTEAYQKDQWTELEQFWSKTPGIILYRIVPLDKLDPTERARVVYLPWFYDCNRDRYSMWEGRPDSRTAP